MITRMGINGERSLSRCVSAELLFPEASYCKCFTSIHHTKGVVTEDEVRVYLELDLSADEAKVER